MSKPNNQLSLQKKQEFDRYVDTNLDIMSAHLTELKIIANTTHDTLNEHDKKIGDLGNNIDRTQTNLDTVNSRLATLIKITSNNTPYYFCIGMLMFILFILIGVYYNVSKK
jgi:hypothetical protein